MVNRHTSRRDANMHTCKIKGKLKFIYTTYTQKNQTQSRIFLNKKVSCSQGVLKFFLGTSVSSRKDLVTTQEASMEITDSQAFQDVPGASLCSLYLAPQHDDGGQGSLETSGLIRTPGVTLMLTLWCAG